MGRALDDWCLNDVLSRTDSCTGYRFRDRNCMFPQGLRWVRDAHSNVGVHRARRHRNTADSVGLGRSFPTWWIHAIGCLDGFSMGLTIGETQLWVREQTGYTPSLVPAFEKHREPSNAPQSRTVLCLMVNHSPRRGDW